MNGKRRLNPEMAARLAEITDKSAREWIEMQAAFDAHQVEKIACKSPGRSADMATPLRST